MHILLIHNNYGAYSGEEAVVARQAALFRQLGHSVSEYRKTTEGERNTLRGNIKGFLQSFYSFRSVQDIKRILKSCRPDVVMVHNLYPFISPAVLKPVREAGIPVVMTVHNYRLICPTGLFMRNAKPCELCLKKRNEWDCIKHNCEHSLLKSIGYAGRNWFARVTRAYTSAVDVYACLTRFQMKKLAEAGYAASRIRHIPNFADAAGTPPDFVSGDYVAVCGRVSKEKGIDMVMDVAAQTPRINYVLAGTIDEEYRAAIESAPDNCTFLGYLPAGELAVFYKNARFLLMASRCYEGFPMAVLEASVHGKPAVVPAHGGFTEIVDNGETGLHFTPGDLSCLKEKAGRLWDNPQEAVRMGRNAYCKLASNYTAGVLKTKWESLLDELKTKEPPRF